MKLSLPCAAPSRHKLLSNYEKWSHLLYYVHDGRILFILNWTALISYK